MIFNEFKNTMDNQTSRIKGENALFWKLWCLTFAFDKIEKNYSNYKIIEDCYKFLWEINDGERKNLNLENSTLDSIEKFSDIEYDDLDDFEVSECAVKEFINSAEVIIRDLKNGQVSNGGQAIYLIPLNIIDIILQDDGMDILDEDGFNTPICLKEINAQLRLSVELGLNNREFSFSDRNIFRATT